MNDLWFSTVNPGMLCRAGGNGPFNPSQLVSLGFVYPGESMLDVGCGSATTAQLKDMILGKSVKYKGVDFIDKNIAWCKENFPKNEFEVQNAMELNEADESWDVVYSRHVVDHLSGFGEAMNEQVRVAKKRVICILFIPLLDGGDSVIQNIKMDGKVYKQEYYNRYGRDEVITYLEELGYPYRIIEKVGLPSRQTDTIIVIEKEAK